MWKPVNIILKLYSEDAYISYFFKLANINRFFETTLHTHGCANPSRMFSSSTGFIRLLWRHIRQNVVRPAPLLRLRPVASIPPQYAYMLQRSYYFFYQQFLLSSVVKSSDGRSPYRLSGKNQGFAQVRGLQASACFQQRFSPLVGRSIVQLLRPQKWIAGVLIVSRLVLAVNSSVQGYLLICCTVLKEKLYNFSYQLSTVKLSDNWLTPVILRTHGFVRYC